jgi:hypothetical protein
VRSSILWLCVLLFTAPFATHAQQIRGVVVEDSTDTPIRGVTIQLLAEDSALLSSVTAAETGWFEFTTQRAGRFFLRVTHEAYSPSGLLQVVVEDREIVNVVVRLSGGPIPLEPLFVTARSRDRLSGFRDRATRGGQGRYITRAQIDQRNAVRVRDVLFFVPEIRIEPVRDGGLVTERFLMRSLGELCAPTVYLDGLPVLTDDAFDIDALISPDAIEGVEIYSSHLTAPLELHVPRNTCGIVAFWTRQLPGRRMTWKRLLLGGAIGAAILLLTR